MMLSEQQLREMRRMLLEQEEANKQMIEDLNVYNKKHLFYSIAAAMQKETEALIARRRIAIDMISLIIGDSTMTVPHTQDGVPAVDRLFAHITIS